MPSSTIQIFLTVLLVLSSLAFNRAFSSPGSALQATPEATGQLKVPTSASKIAFISNRSGRFQMYLMNTNGSNQHALISKEVQWVAWLPDGKSLSFTSPEGGNAIFQIAPGGSNIQSIPTNGSPIGPAWSPDKKLIAYTMFSLAINDFRLYIMNADGSNARLLTDQKDFNPVWSPDGKRIAFSWMWMKDPKKGGAFAVCTINADGSNRQCLTDPQGNNVAPAWSPDGKSIIFSSVREGKADVYIMDANGKNEYRLSTTGNNALAAWSPDGKSIVFTSDRDGNPEVYIMNADGKNEQRLTVSPGSDLYPSWQPAGTIQASLTPTP